jgi:hypothetical protein
LMTRLTINTARVFGGEFGNVPYLVVDYDPTITGMVVS